MNVTTKLGPGIRALAVSAPHILPQQALVRIQGFIDDGASDFDVLTALTAYLMNSDRAPPRDSRPPKLEGDAPPVRTMREVGKRLAHLMETGKTSAMMFEACDWIIKDMTANGYEPSGMLYAERRKWKGMDRTGGFGG